MKEVLKVFDKNSRHIVIIGAGPAGIAAGYELKKQGFNNFTIIEKESAAGGTWHMQTYPGLACDVWAHSYTFSYAPNPNWSQVFVNQSEIEAYIQQCVKQFELGPHIQFNCRIVKAELQEDKQWLLHADDNSQYLADAVINAMGNQHTPLFPKISGMESFQGSSWHSAQWNHDIDLSNKRVVVIGSAAAAVQIIPEIAKKVKHLSVLQRSANWIVPRNNKPYSVFKRALFKRLPWLMIALRQLQAWMMNFVFDAVVIDSKRMTMFENMGKKFIAKAIDDEALQALVTPDSRYGCKRPLVSDDFYPSLNRDNVRLVPCGASSINAAGVMTSDGEQIDADVIVYCTGYHVMDFDRFDVIGENGVVLAEQMFDAPQAFKGIAVPNFPNYFLGVGPNALVLSVSYYRSVEANMSSIVNLLTAMAKEGVRAIDVEKSKHDIYNDWIVDECKRFSWGSGACDNYYINEQGHSPFLYPANYKHFLAMRAGTILDDFKSV